MIIVKVTYTINPDFVVQNQNYMKTQNENNTECMLTCELTSQELRERKNSILIQLREKITEKKELEHGYAFKFPGTNAMLDELVEFVKTERECCDFFLFSLSIAGNKKEIWLELTGPEGTKDFVVTELEF